MVEHYLPFDLFKGPPRPLSKDDEADIFGTKRRPPKRRVVRTPTRRVAVRPRGRVRRDFRVGSVGNKASNNVRYVLYGGNSHAAGYYRHVRGLYNKRGKENNIKYVMVRYDSPQGGGGELTTQLKRYNSAVNRLKRKHGDKFKVEAAYHVGFNFGKRSGNKRDTRYKSAFQKLLGAQKGLTNNVVVLTSPLPKKKWRGARHRDRWRKEGASIVKQVGGTYNNSQAYPHLKLRDNVHLGGNYRKSGRQRLAKIPYDHSPGPALAPRGAQITSRVPIPTAVPPRVPTTAKRAATPVSRTERRLDYLTTRKKGLEAVFSKLDPKDEAELQKLRTQVEKQEYKASGGRFGTASIRNKDYKYKSVGYEKVGNRSRLYQRIVKRYGPAMEAAAKRFGKTPEERRELQLFLAGTMSVCRVRR